MRMNNNFIPSGDKILLELGVDLKKIKDVKPRSKRSSYKAAINWLTKYSPNPNASNLEIIQGLLEAFYHLCHIEEWEKASKIISTRLYTPTNEALHNQLKTWGYYQHQIYIYHKLLRQINSDWDAICLNGLGNAARALGEWEESQKYYQNQLDNYEKIIDKNTQITALIGLANNFKFQSQYQQATNYYLEVSEIAFETSNHKARMMALAGLGSVLTCLGQYEIALEYHQKQFNIATRTKDNLGEAEALSNLGYVYYFLKDYERAIDYQSKSEEIAKNLEYKELEAKSLLYTGMNYYKIGRNELAIYFYEQSLIIISDMNLVLEKAEVLANLAISEKELEKDNIKKLEEVIERFQQALSIFDNCGYYIQVANVLQELANTFYLTDNFDTAKKYYEQALEMAIQLNIPLKEECRELLTKLNAQQQYSFKIPNMQEIDEQECESFKSKVDVLIMTVTDPEITSVLELLQPYPRRKKVLKVFSGPETYYIGKFGLFNTVVTKCRMGSTGQGSAILAAREALAKWNPKATIMVGIAFGKDEKKQNIGDILVASEVIWYESQRVSEKEKIIYRESHRSSNTTLLNRFENVHHWQFNGINNLPCQIIHGAILSGEKLVDNPDFKAELFKEFPEAIGGEMEGAGLSSACMRVGKPWILVKSICDWADGKKQSKYQPLAARAAASLIHHVLQQKTVLNGID